MIIKFSSYLEAYEREDVMDKKKHPSLPQTLKEGTIISTKKNK
jgi:hypothetical protein